MLFKSLVFSQASGSTGGLVYSRNQGGMYVRARAKPTNPNSEAQGAVRDAMRDAVYAWSNTLTDTQREGWNTYAFNTPTWNRLGEATTKTGQQMFIRGAIPRIQAGIGVPTIASSSFDLGDISPPTAIEATDPGDSITFEFDSLDDWVTSPGSALLVYQSRPQNATRTYGKGPYQLATMIEGASVTPPESPATFSSLFPLTTGQRVFLKFNVSMFDGRFTTPIMTSVIVTA